MGRVQLPAHRALPGAQGHQLHGLRPGHLRHADVVWLPQEAQDAPAAGVPFPGRQGTWDDYARLVRQIVENEMLNGEVIRLDGAIRLTLK